MNNNWVLLQEYKKLTGIYDVFCKELLIGDFEQFTLPVFKVDLKLGDKVLKNVDQHTIFLFRQEDFDRDSASYGPQSKIKHLRNTPCPYTQDMVGKMLLTDYKNTEELYTAYEPEDCFVRVTEKDFAHLMKVKSMVQVGDFVRFSSSNRIYKWRKILEIHDYQILGQCASAPSEDKLVFHSSKNGMLFLKEIVRDGIKIL